MEEHENWIADKGILSWVGHKISRLASIIFPSYFSKTQRAADIYAELMSKQPKNNLLQLEYKADLKSLSSELLAEPRLMKTKKH